jgi:hypothetical protein
MKPIIYTSRIATEAVELENILIRTRLKSKVTLLYLGEDFKHSQIPMSFDYNGNLGKYIPTFVHNNVSHGDAAEIVRILKRI